MANYTNLKNLIDQYITTNGQGDITGAILNDVLKNIVNSIGADFLFAGVVEPTSNPGSPDQNVFYIAIKGGTYTNFGNVVIPDGIAIFKWNGSWSNQILFAGDGGVFDITAYKNNTKYADLTAALGTNGANVPGGLRKGGMSVKFVQSSDNKYVQYRLMSDTWSITPSDWQGVDDEPTSGSKNLVTSGGVAEYIADRVFNNENAVSSLQSTLELGSISGLGTNTWTYQSSTTRLRTKQGTYLNLFKGDTIRLSDYTNAKMYIGCDGDYTKGSQGWLTADFIVPANGRYVVLLTNIVEEEVTVEGLGSRLQLKSNSLGDSAYKGVDDVPTAGSKNLVESGGTALMIKKTNETLEGKADKENLFYHTVNLFDGEIIPNSWILSTTGQVSERAGNFVTKNLIPVEYGKKYHFSRFNGTIRRENDNYFCEFDTNGDPIITETPLKGATYKVTNQNVKYIKVSFLISSGQTAESTKAMVYEWDARAMWMSDQFSDYYLYQTAYQEYGYEKVLPLAYSRKGKKMICFGDSITDFGFYPEYAGYILEMDVVNMGFGGMRMTNTANNAYDRALSMYELIQAIIADDFTTQTAAATHYANEHPKWSEKISQLSSIDFDTVDVITIEYGVNDFSGGVSIGEDTDTTPTTIKGAINLIIEQIKTNYPKIQVVIIPPMYRRYGDNNETDSDSYVINTKKLPDVVEAEETIAKLNHCEYLELYWTLGVNKYNWQTFLADSTHPNNIGYVEIGRRLAGYLGSH